MEYIVTRSKRMPVEYGFYILKFG